ncbi:MAG: DUF2341 domain-containing protein [Myxococcota bacterium]
MTTQKRLVGGVLLGLMLGCPTPRPALPPVCMLRQTGCDSPQQPWDDIRWPFRRRIEVSSPLDVSLTDVVVPVRLDEGFEYACAGPDRVDLLFVDDQGEPLEHEIDEWSVDVEAVVWVRLPQLDPSGASLWMYYGHRLAEPLSEVDPWSSEAAGLEAVLHFGGDLDDARGEHDGQVVEEGAVSAYNEGMLGQAVHFEEANVGSRVELADVSPIDAHMEASRAFTVTAWIRPTPSVTGDQFLRTVISRGGNAWAMSISDEDDGVPHDYVPPVQAAFYSYCGISKDCEWPFEQRHFLTGSSNPVIQDELDAIWHHVAIVYEEIQGASSTARKSLYVDGELEVPLPIVPMPGEPPPDVEQPGVPRSVEGDLDIPWEEIGPPLLVVGSSTSGTVVFHGDIDEVHIASMAWTPERIAAEYEFAADERLVDVLSPECR